MSRAHSYFVAVAAAALAGCHRPAPVGTYPAAPVILISIDTLRADRLPAYGYAAGRDARPRPAGARGVLFEDVYSHVPLTLPAHASLLTGSRRRGTACATTSASRSRPRRARWPSASRRRASPTGAAVSAYVLRAPDGIAAGFDSFDDALEIDGGDRSRSATRSATARWRWTSLAGGSRTRATSASSPSCTSTSRTPPTRLPRAHARFAQPYDGDVAYADELVGRLPGAAYAARAVLDRTIVAVTSDHGEGLSDHGEEEHGLFLYREAVARAAARCGCRGRPRRHAREGRGRPGRRRADAPRAGRPARGRAWTASRCARRWRAGQAAARPGLLGDALPALPLRLERALRGDRRPLSLHPRAAPGAVRLVQDPAEKTNLFAARASAADAMNAWLERQVQAGTVARAGGGLRGEREKLQALGYVGTAGAAGADRRRAARSQGQDRRRRGAEEGAALRRSGRLTEAVAQFREGAGGQPADVRRLGDARLHPVRPRPRARKRSRRWTGAAGSTPRAAART